MDFYETLDQVIDLLKQRGRMTYRTLRRQFALDEETLEDLKAELLFSHPVVDEDGTGRVWTGETASIPVTTSQPDQPEPQPAVEQAQPVQATSSPVAPHTPEAERRQLTVMFVDLVGSTSLSGELDPEDLREVIRTYQATCTEVIHRYDGYVAQLLGDGLLVYFGYPQAHEDDAQRAVRTGLGIVEAIRSLNTGLEQEKGITLAVRLGIHTGLVVVGEMGGSGRQEQLALGEAPNMAARLQGLAEPDTVVISADTYRLIQGYFDCDSLGEHDLRGVSQAIVVYRVVQDSGAQSRLDIASARGLTPLVGRESEVTLLRERWVQSTDGMGQVVVLSGEAGIGKSRLVHVLTEQVVDEHTLRLTLRCSPYHTNSAFYPVIEHFQRVLQWHRDVSPEAKLATLEQAIQMARLPLAEVVPLIAALLLLPVPERYPPLTLTPQRQKQKTQETLVTWLLAEAAQQPVLAIWEDLHWADPSTLELLELLLDQVPTTRLLMVLTCRPEFRPPWTPYSYVTPLTLSRLSRPQIEEMVLRVTGGKPLPTEVVRQIVTKTDGIPLFVEELVKMILESGLVQEDADCYRLTGPLPPLAIPSTLHDSLMARLDRLSVARDLAQLGAVLGREFAYELLHAVSTLDETMLQQGLAQLVDAELVYQRGLPPRSRYVFKHALIQETAYQSLLKSTRQRYHQRTAQVLEAQFPETVETQPELVAHHYTEAGFAEDAVPYWQRAGQRALQGSASAEAIAHLTQGLAVLTTLPETPAHLQQELDLQVALGTALRNTKGHAAPEVEHTYARARELCAQLGGTPQLFPVLRGLMQYYQNRGDLQTTTQLGEQLLRLAQAQPDPALRLLAHYQLGQVLFYRGEPAAAQAHLTQALALYDPQAHRALAVPYGLDLGVGSHNFLARALWCLGFPEQAVQHSQAARTLAEEVAHPVSLAQALVNAAIVHQCRREVLAAHAQAAAAMTLATEQGFAQRVARGTVLHGWSLAMQGQSEAGLAEMRQGLAAELATGATSWQPYSLGLLAEAYGTGGHPDAGLTALAEALAVLDTTELRYSAAELSRLKGALLLQAVPDTAQAEACFQQALDVARHQQAKSLELRAAMSLAKLWQSQDKRQDAYDLLAPVYHWFTEGFDTADLQDAKALLEELA